MQNHLSILEPLFTCFDVHAVDGGGVILEESFGKSDALVDWYASDDLRIRASRFGAGEGLRT